MMYESNSGPRKVLYRSRDGYILGVCKGLADYFDFPVFWMRVLAVLAVICSWFFALIAYIVAAIVMKQEPVVPFENDNDREFYESYTSSRNMASQRLKRMYDSLDRRVQRMEDAVTAREYDWDRRMNE